VLVEIGIQKWRCVECKKEVFSKKLPEGWKILDRNFTRKEIEHHCENCKKDGIKYLF
jgi:hypothetical protein